MTTKPPPAVARPVIRGSAPWPAGTRTGVHALPPSPLSHAPPATDLPVAVATSPAIRIRFPAAAAYLTLSTWPAPAATARCSCAAPNRCQLIPLAERNTTGLDFALSEPGTLAPA